MEFGWKQYWFQYAETVTLFAGYVLPENQEYNVGIYFPGESSFKSVYIQGQTLYVIRELLYIWQAERIAYRPGGYLRLFDVQVWLKL